MSRKLASIQRISEIKPIEGADRICAYKVQGWWVVDAVDRYVVGDLAIYFELDSWIPTETAPFLSKGAFPREYNGVKGEKLRTVRLKGQLSQGLLMPIHSDHTGQYIMVQSDVGEYSLAVTEGDDVTEALGIQKWEPQENAQLGGQTKGSFPSHTPKTDEDRIQNLGADLRRWQEEGAEWYMEEKLEGSSLTIYCKDGEVGVCSRNQELKEDDQNSFWKAVKKYNLPEKLKTLCQELNVNLSLQGELVGPGIQGGIYKLSDVDVYFFNIHDINKGCKVEPETKYFTLKQLGVKTVPVLGTFRMDSTFTTDRLLEMADGKSMLRKETNREGIVFKKADGSETFKAVSNAYLLKTGG